MCKNEYAVLLDVPSIQHYVFSSSKTKENIGASYVISIVLNSITDDIKKKFAGYRDGYSGGGKILIFFPTEDNAKDFIKMLSRTLLVETPGLYVACAYKKFDMSNFQSEINSLHNILFYNKKKYSPNITIGSFGITEDCPRTGLSAEVWEENAGESGAYISSVSKTKFKYSDKAHELFKKETNEFLLKDIKEYEFPKDFDELGSKKGESNIAIVHIDVNDMGEYIKNNSTSLDNLQKISQDLSESTKNSFFELVKHILEKHIINCRPMDVNFGKNLIPIRPIIIGGDDITFVSDARLGIYFAQKFIEYFENDTKKKKINKDGLSACAGIAITKLKYPFYRGYQLSEELCSNAKKYRRNSTVKKSWIDYHFATGSISGTIEEIRKKELKGIQGNLFMKPYYSGIESDEFSFGDILATANHWNKMIENGNFAKSKAKEFKEILTLGKNATEQFLINLENKGLEIPYINNFNKFERKKLFGVKGTPYLDVLELMEI